MRWLPLLAPVAPLGRERGNPMPTKINDDSMPLEIDGRVIATAEFSGHAAADGRGAWIVSIHPGRLFTATRPSRPLCSRNGSPPATARMTRS